MEHVITLAAFADEASADLAGQIAALKRNQLTHLELRGVDGKNCADLTAVEAKELRRRLDAGGVTVQTVGSPIGKVPVSQDPAQERERFLRVQETAQILGADKLRIFSFYRDASLSEDAGRERALNRLREFCDRAEITLCHENEKGIYGDGWEFCKVLCTQLSLRAVFDPANFIQCGMDTAKAWAELKEFTEYLHLKDARKDGVIVPCGEGVGNVPQILGDFLERGGRYATVEPHLAHFAGRGQLEQGADRPHAEYRYNDAGEAFDAAINAVKAIVTEKGGEIL